MEHVNVSSTMYAVYQMLRKMIPGSPPASEVLHRAKHALRVHVKQTLHGQVTTEAANDGKFRKDMM